MGKVATEPLSPGGVPTASVRGAESEVARKWAGWLHDPCRLGGPHRFTAGGSIRGGPQVGKVATQPLSPGGSPPLRSGGQNQRWPASGQGGYMTLAASGIPTASERGAASEVAHKWARWLHKPCRLGGPHRLGAGGQHQRWPTSGQGGYISPVAWGGFPPLRSGGQNQRWPASGQGGYMTLAASGIPTASQRGAASEVAHKWATWLHNPCRLGGAHHFAARGRIRGGPQVGKVAT